MSNKLKVVKKSKKQSDRERIAVLEKMVTLNYGLIKDLYKALSNKEEVAKKEVKEDKDNSPS
jgi:hypothetical protein